jgi:hypothetical protein
LVGRELARQKFGVELLAVEEDFEGAARRLDELDFAVIKGVLEFSGQTGRLGQVVSGRAVLDAILHRN